MAGYGLQSGSDADGGAVVPDRFGLAAIRFL
jgi:hypothetical protein